MAPMVPWYRGFKGEIRENASKTGFDTVGIITQQSEDTLLITELPVKRWTQVSKGRRENNQGRECVSEVRLKQESLSRFFRITKSGLKNSCRRQTKKTLLSSTSEIAAVTKTFTLQSKWKKVKPAARCLR